SSGCAHRVSRSPTDTKSTRGIRSGARLKTIGLRKLRKGYHLKQTNDRQSFRFFVVEIPEKFILMPPSYPARWQTEYRISRALAVPGSRGASDACCVCQ